MAGLPEPNILVITHECQDKPRLKRIGFASRQRRYRQPRWVLRAEMNGRLKLECRKQAADVYSWVTAAAKAAAIPTRMGLARTGCRVPVVLQE
jgi:hypothetical protein